MEHVIVTIPHRPSVHRTSTWCSSFLHAEVLMHVLCVSVHCTCVFFNRACQWAPTSARLSVLIDGPQALHLQPGVTNFSPSVSRQAALLPTHTDALYVLRHTKA